MECMFVERDRVGVYLWAAETNSVCIAFGRVSRYSRSARLTERRECILC
jgi:hypothetical protein